MAETESRAGIIAAIKSPLGLTALIVLVGETLTLFAMRSTSKDDPFYKWYFVIMIGLLVLLIPAYYIYLLQNKPSHQQQTIIVEGQKLNAVPVQSASVPNTATEERFTDSNFGFSLIAPQSAEWQKSDYLSHKEYLKKLGLVNTDSDYINFQNNLEIMHFGDVLLNSSTVFFQYGSDTDIHFNKDTTTDSVEYYVKKIAEKAEKNNKPMTDDEISQLRYNANFGATGINKIRFSNSFSITIMPKNKLAAKQGIQPNLSNLFLILTTSSQQPMDELMANAESILWKSTTKLYNAEINNNLSDIIIYRIERLLQNANNFFILTIQWSPNSNSAYTIWNDLQKMFESFRLSTK